MAEPTPQQDREMVEVLLGRPPMGTFHVALRRHDGSPVLLENEPFFSNGRPMPTRFWLADRALGKTIGRLEAEGGVLQAEREIADEDLARTHRVALAQREARIADDHVGPRPSGGVGGTRLGVKCLHAHYANWLGGATDAVGDWVQARLVADGTAFDPAEPGVATEMFGPNLGQES